MMPASGYDPRERSPGELTLRAFLRHRLAVASLVLLSGMYLCAALAEFVAPYPPGERSRAIYAPPTVPRVVDDGRLVWPPVIDALTGSLDPETFQRVYVRDPERRYELRLLAPSEPYRLFGFVPMQARLFGTADGGRVHLFGTDALGRDVFSRVVHGARISLSIGLVGVALSLLFGVAIGGLAGLLGGAVDSVVQRVIEVIQSFPAIPLWMALAAALPREWPIVAVYFGITVVLSGIGWTDVARVVRGKFLALREEDFVTAAIVGGASRARVIQAHMLPSFSSHVIATVTLAVPGMILAETSLSFLGIGLRPPAVSWGVMLQDAQQVFVIALAPWLLLPGVAVVVAVLAFNFLGDGIRDAVDPNAQR